MACWKQAGVTLADTIRKHGRASVEARRDRAHCTHIKAGSGRWVQTALEGGMMGAVQLLDSDAMEVRAAALDAVYCIVKGASEQEIELLVAQGAVKNIGLCIHKATERVRLARAAQFGSPCDKPVIAAEAEHQRAVEALGYLKSYLSSGTFLKARAV